MILAVYTSQNELDADEARDFELDADDARDPGQHVPAKTKHPYPSQGVPLAADADLSGRTWQITRPAPQMSSSHNIEPTTPSPPTYPTSSTYPILSSNPSPPSKPASSRYPHTFSYSASPNIAPLQRPVYYPTVAQPFPWNSRSSDAAQPKQEQTHPSTETYSKKQQFPKDQSVVRPDIPRSQSAPTLATYQGFRVYKPGVVSGAEVSYLDCIAILDSCGYDGNRVSRELLEDLGADAPSRGTIKLRIVATADGPVRKSLTFYVEFAIWDRPGAVLLLGRDWIKERWVKRDWKENRGEDGTFYTHPGSRKKGK